MVRIRPESAEDRQRILDYCEGQKINVVNERDIDDCVVVEMDGESIPCKAMLTGCKTNAHAKFKVMKEERQMNLLAELLALHEVAKWQAGNYKEYDGEYVTTHGAGGIGRQCRVKVSKNLKDKFGKYDLTVHGGQAEFGGEQETIVVTLGFLKQLGLKKLNEAVVTEGVNKSMTVDQLLDLADHFRDSDDLTPLLKGKDKEIEGWTTDDHGHDVVEVCAWYRSNRWTASIAFDDSGEVTNVYVQKDKTYFRR